MFINYLESIPAAIAQGIIWGIMAIGVYITYKVLDIADLTVDGSICTGAAVCAVLTINGAPMWLALLAAMIAGMITGFITGIFHTFMGIPAILAGILTQLILYSANLKILGAANKALPPQRYNLIITRLEVYKTLFILAIACIIIIGLLYMFFGTEFGSSIRATGANLVMSRAQGINTDKTKIFGLALSNGFVALSGAFLCQYQGYSDVNMGVGSIVIGLASIIIGEALFARAKNFMMKLFGIVVGSIIYRVVVALVIFSGMPSTDLKLMTAVVVIIALTIPHLFKKGHKKKKVMAKNKEVAENE